MISQNNKQISQYILPICSLHFNGNYKNYHDNFLQVLFHTLYHELSIGLEIFHLYLTTKLYNRF